MAFYIITCNKLFLHVGHLLIAFCVFTYKRNKYIYINIYSLPDGSNLLLSSWFTVGVWITARFIHSYENLYREEVSDRIRVYIDFVRADSAVRVTVRKIRAKVFTCRIFSGWHLGFPFVVSPDFLLEMNFLFICIHNFCVCQCLLNKTRHACKSSVF